MASLIYSDISGSEYTVELGGESILIGRDPGCAIRSDDPLLSREHARLFFDGANYWLEDLGSSNGVFVGRERVERGMLVPGEIAVVGGLVLQLSGDAIPTGTHAILAAKLRTERAQRRGLTEERNALGARLGELHGEVAQLRAQNDLDDIERDQLQEETVRQLAEELERARACHREAVDRSEELQAQLASERAEQTERQSQAQKRDHELEQLQFQLTRLRAEIQIASDRAAEAEAQLARRASDATASATLQIEVESLRLEVDTLRGELETSEEATARAAQEHAETVATLQADRKKLGSAASKLETDVARLEACTTNLETENARLEASTTKLEADNARLIAEAAAATTRRAESQVAADDTKSQLLVAQAECAELSAEVDTLRAESAAAEDLNTERESNAAENANREATEKQELKDRLAKSTAAVTDLGKELKGARAKFSNASAELEGAKSDVDGMRAQLVDAHAELEGARVELESVRTELDSARAGQSAAVAAGGIATAESLERSKTLKDELETATSALVALTAQRDELQQFVAKSTSEADERERVASQQFEESRLAAESLRTQHDAAVAAAAAFESELEELRAQHVDLTAQLADSGSTASADKQRALDAEQDATRLRAALDVATQTIAQAKEHAEASDREAQRQSDEVRGLQAAIQATKEASAKNAENTEASATQRDKDEAHLRSELQARKEELVGIREQLANAKTTCTAYDGELTELRSQLAAQGSKSAERDGEVARLRDEVSKSESRVRESETELTQLRERFEGEVATLKERLAGEVAALDEQLAGEVAARAALKEQLAANATDSTQVSKLEVQLRALQSEFDAQQELLRANQESSGVESERADSERLLRRQAEESQLELEDRIAELEQQHKALQQRHTYLEEQRASEGSAEPVANVPTIDLPKARDHLLTLESAVSSLRANLRAASDEAAVLPGSDDSVGAINDSLSAAIEELETARDGLRGLTSALEE